jgi:protein-S-isoprenylcysteine O-methyltransferase Ste14
MKATSILFGLVVGILLVVLFPYVFYSANDRLDLFVFDSNTLRTIGILLIIVGGSLFLYCSSLFKIFGKGTPIPIEPPKKIVQQGLYKYVRNPMYLGYFAIVIGEALLFGAALLFAYALVFILLTHIYVVYKLCQKTPGF